MSNGITYNDIRNRFSNKSLYNKNISISALIKESQESFQGMEDLIKNYDLLKEAVDENLILPTFLKQVESYVNTYAMTESEVNKVSNIINEYIVTPSFSDYTFDVLHEEHLLNTSTVYNIIIENLMDDYNSTKKYKSIKRNINMLDNKIKLSKILESNLRLSNTDHIIDLVESICVEIDRTYNLRDIVKFGVTMESVKIAMEKYNFDISSEDILYSIGEYYYLKENTLSPFIISNAIKSSVVYSEASKTKILDFLELSISADDLTYDAELDDIEIKKLPDEMFGLRRERQFPLVDRKRIRLAKSYFGTCPNRDKPRLAKNILKQSRFLNVNVNEDSDWFKFTKEEEIKEVTSKYFEDGHSLVPVIVEAKKEISADKAIKFIKDKYLKNKDTSPKAAKKFLNKLYAKPLDNIIDDTPNTLHILRRVVLIGGGFAINPFLGVALGLIDNLISQVVNIEQAKKLEKKVEQEFDRMEKRLSKTDLSDEEKKGYNKYLAELEKRKERIATHIYNLTSDLEFKEEEEESDGVTEMAFIMAIAEAVDEFSIEEVSASKVITQKVKNKGKKTVQNMSAADHKLSKALDQKVEAFKDKINKAAKNDRREAIVKGQLIPSASKVLKIAVASGVAFAVNPAIAIIGLLAGVGISKHSNAKERKLILDEIGIELKIVDKKIETAERNDDMKAYAELLRIKKKLEYERKRIKYKLTTGNNL